MTQEEFKEEIKKAEAGDSNAQYRVGRIYFANTLNGNEDCSKEAFEWAQKSAAQNNADGLCLLGAVWERNGDMKKSVECYERAADLGSVKAMSNLAQKYFWSLDKETEAKQLLKKAVEQNLFGSKEFLAEVNSISELWEIAKKTYSYDDVIPIWNKAKGEIEDYIYNLNFQGDGNEEKLCLTKLKHSDGKTRVGEFFSISKSQFYNGYRDYTYYIDGSLKLGELKPKKLGPILVALFHSLEKHTQLPEVINWTEFAQNKQR